MASSTYALMRSLGRRLEKIETLIERIGVGDLHEQQLAAQQSELDFGLNEDPFETQTADEQFPVSGLLEDLESQEEFEDRALGAGIGLSVAELADERDKVFELLNKARRLYERGHESKFEKLREVLRSPDYAGEKFIVFTEHRDTAQFLTRRLEGLGFTGRIASVHGGMDHQERESQVEFFRRLPSEGRRQLSGCYRCSWRRHQPPILLVDGELRHPLESGSSRATHGAHPSIRSTSRHGGRHQSGLWFNP